MAIVLGDEHTPSCMLSPFCMEALQLDKHSTPGLPRMVERLGD